MGNEIKHKQVKNAIVAKIIWDLLEGLYIKKGLTSECIIKHVSTVCEVPPGKVCKQKSNFARANGHPWTVKKEANYLLFKLFCETKWKTKKDCSKAK